MRTARPAPVYAGLRRKETSVEQLAWGHLNEPWLIAQFWKRHQEYDLYDERWCWWYNPADKVHWDHCGTSPDSTLWQEVNGFPKRVSVLEVKCPFDRQIHRQYRDIGDLPIEYKAQTFWHMICTDAPSCWFVSGDPRQRGVTNYFELLVERDPRYETILMHKVDRFIGGYLRGETFQPTEYNRQTYEEIFK